MDYEFFKESPESHGKALEEPPLLGLLLKRRIVVGEVIPGVLDPRDEGLVTAGLCSNWGWIQIDHLSKSLCKSGPIGEGQLIGKPSPMLLGSRSENCTDTSSCGGPGGSTSLDIVRM